MNADRILPPILVALLLTHCTLSAPPKEQALEQQGMEHVEIPAHWLAGKPGAGAVDPQWLKQFGSAQLNALVDEALANNLDLKLYAARMDQAAALVKQAEGAIYPMVQILAHGGGKLGGDNSGFRGVVISSSWEIDLWGRIRYGVRASEAQYFAAQQDAQFARQSLAASVAKTWLLAVESAHQCTLAQRDLQSARQLANLAQVRLSVGAGTAAELAQAQSDAALAAQHLQQWQLARDQSTQALNLLLGRYPSAQMALAADLPAMPGPVPAGLPSQLLERRPDVLAATQRVVAAFNQTQEAKAELLPRISLTIALASLSSGLVALSNQDNPFWSSGASILAPLFQGGTLRAQVEARSAGQQEALAIFSQTGLKAFGEVETALAADISLEQQHLQQRAQRDASKRQLAITQSQEQIGAVDQRAVLQQQRQTLAQESALLRLERERLSQRVNLYLALGGDFT